MKSSWLPFTVSSTDLFLMLLVSVKAFLAYPMVFFVLGFIVPTSHQQKDGAARTVMMWILGKQGGSPQESIWRELRGLFCCLSLRNWKQTMHWLDSVQSCHSVEQDLSNPRPGTPPTGACFLRAEILTWKALLGPFQTSLDTPNDNSKTWLSHLKLEHCERK